MASDIVLKFIYAGCLFILTIILSLLPHYVKIPKRLLSALNVMAGGVFLASSLCHLLPTSIEQFDAYINDKRNHDNTPLIDHNDDNGHSIIFPWGQTMLGIGFLCTLYVERIAHGLSASTSSNRIHNHYISRGDGRCDDITTINGPHNHCSDDYIIDTHLSLYNNNKNKNNNDRGCGRGRTRNTAQNGMDTDHRGIYHYKQDTDTDNDIVYTDTDDIVTSGHPHHNHTRKYHGNIMITGPSLQYTINNSDYHCDNDDDHGDATDNDNDNDDTDNDSDSDHNNHDDLTASLTINSQDKNNKSSPSHHHHHQHLPRDKHSPSHSHSKHSHNHDNNRRISKHKHHTKHNYHYECNQHNHFCSSFHRGHGHYRHHNNMTEAEDQEHGHSHLPLNNTNTIGKNTSIVLFIAIWVALSFHSILEGITLGSSSDNSKTMSLLIAILSHKGLEAFALGTNLIKAKLKTQKTIIFALLYSAMTPIGISIGLAFTSDTSGLATAILTGFAAGTFFYVGAIEVIQPEMQTGKDTPIKCILLALGYAAMALLAIWA